MRLVVAAGKQSLQAVLLDKSTPSLPPPPLPLPLSLSLSLSLSPSFPLPISLSR